MKQKFIIGIDQSTQGTKAILFDEKGNLLHRTDRSHAQLIDERGWVEHDPEEIYRNTLLVVEELLGKSGVDREAVACVGIRGKQPWRGTGIPGNPSITPSSGSAPGERRYAGGLR